MIVLDNGFKMGQKRENLGLASTVLQQPWQSQWHFLLLLSVVSGLALFVVVSLDK